MKNILIGILALVFFAGNVNGETENAISIEKALSQITKNHAVRIVGWDRIAGARELIPNSATILAAIANLDISKVSKAIVDGTDYECLRGQDYLVIVPKINPSRYNTPVSRRMINIPQTTNVSQNEFLRLLQPVKNDKETSVILSSSSFLMSQLSGGSISTESGKAFCYEVLNDMARQLKAQRWTMENPILVTDDGSTSPKTETPMTLGHAVVTFFANN